MKPATPRKVENYLNVDRKDIFQEWQEGLTDVRAQVLIDKTISKVRLGNLGDHKSVGDGVQEIRLDYGPGYRIYLGEHGSVLVILLGGGTKKRQQQGIDQAKRNWEDWKERTLR